jgi:hypothetical protein
MPRHHKPLRQKSRATASRPLREENPVHRARRRSHPISAVKPFIFLLVLLLAALFVMQQFGVRLSAFSILLYGIFVLLTLFAVAVAYLTHARDYSFSDDDFEGLPETGQARRSGYGAARRRR